MASDCFERCRLQAGLGLREASAALGVATTMLANYEKGEQEPDALVLKRMALTYGCTADELLGLTEGSAISE